MAKTIKHKWTICPDSEQPMEGLICEDDSYDGTDSEQLMEGLRYEDDSYPCHNSKHTMKGLVYIN